MLLRAINRISERCTPDRVAAWALSAFVVLWTLIAVLSKAAQDVHFDVGELISWWREPSLRYHPPMATWVAGSWFALFPRQNWAAYLLGVASVAIAFTFAWLLFRERLDEPKRLSALAMLWLMPLYTFFAAKFNANLVLVPFWGATIYFFLWSFQTRRALPAALAGAAGAGALLGKYWSIFLIGGLIAAAVIDPRRRVYWRSAAPWITLAVGLCLVAPYVAIEASGSRATVGYAAAVMQPLSFKNTIGRSLGYVAGAIGYVSVPLLLLWALRTPRAALRDILWPRDADRRLIVATFFLPLLLPAILNLVVPTRLTSLWTIPNWLLLPVVLLQSPLVRVTRAQAARLLGIAVLFAVAMLATAPLLAAIMHRHGRNTQQAYYRDLAEAAHARWQAATTAPLRYLGGDPELARGAAFYLPSGAANASGHGDAAVISASGIALLCDRTDHACIQRMEPFRRTDTVQSETTLTVSFAGWHPRSQGFVIMIVPPVDSPASRE